MNIMDIYTNEYLEYPLTDNEYKYLNDTWEFIDTFNIGQITMHEYRNSLINIIKKKYEPKDFNFFEIISEKLFWNLKKVILREMNYTEQFEELNIDEIDLLKEKLQNDNYYRSFINKIVNIDFEQKKIYYKKMEGSSHIFSNNKINQYISKIFFNRNLYEYVMSNREVRKNILNKPSIYYQMDYGFPNLNLCKPFIYNTDDRIKRIKFLYYDKNCSVNWTKLFYFNI